MDTYEVLSLLFLGGTFLIALLAYLDNRTDCSHRQARGVLTTKRSP